MDVNLLHIFVTVGLAHFLALLSPGPDFVMIVKSASKHSSKDALGVVAGITMANAVYIGLCLVGVGSILAASAPIMLTLKLIGGLFLTYLGVQALRARKHNYSELSQSEEQRSHAVTKGAQTTLRKEFATGFISGIFNPKNLLFYLHGMRRLCFYYPRVRYGASLPSVPIILIRSQARCLARLAWLSCARH